jgi:uncharacterized protein
MLKKIAVVLFLISSTATAASFDCTKATSKAEKLICSTPALSQADDALAVDYLQAKLVTDNSADFKALVKQNWKLREKNCETEECLLNWYKRSTELYRQIAAHKSAPVYPDQNQQPESTISAGKTIDDFFTDNPALAKNIYIKKAIDDIAKGQSFSDSFTGALTSKSRGSSILRAMSDNALENGYDYARLAVRSLQNSCELGMGNAFGLRDNECQILSRYQDRS